MNNSELVCGRLGPLPAWTLKRRSQALKWACYVSLTLLAGLLLASLVMPWVLFFMLVW